MRVVLVALAIVGLVGCCSAAPPPVESTAPAVAIVQEPPTDPSLLDPLPRVVRRLVAETRLQVEKNRQMASEVQDRRGRERALGEASDLERELSVLELRIENPDSDNLDDVMRRLQLLDTRVDLLHDKLLGATSRTSAMTVDR